MNYEGVIIEESLKDKAVLNDLAIISTKVEPVTPEHKTSWLEQWTLHTVRVPEDKADQIAEKLSHSLDRNYWYADFKNESTHYIIFPDKVFKIDRTKADEYNAATEFGLTLGIPDYQLDFAPNVVEWQRLKD
jgi:hypothetical protein